MKLSGGLLGGDVSTGENVLTIQPNFVYYFRKSGNRVAAIEPTNYGGRGNWVVRRVDGASAGKEMIVSGRSLLSKLD